MRPTVVAALVLCAGLAGCIQALEGPPSAGVEALADDSPRWPAPIVTNAHGNLTADQSQAAAPDLPSFVERLLPDGGAEPNIGVTSSGAVFVTSYDRVYRSTDHGRNWTEVHQFTSPNWPESADRYATADPMLWVDPLTDRVFVSHMHPGLTCNYLAYSDDEGETWTDDDLAVAPGIMSCATPRIDHQKIMTAPQAQVTGEPPMLGYDNMLYLCYNKLELGTWCAASRDSGATWTQDVMIHRPALPEVEEGCPGINGHPAAYPDGTVVVPMGGAFDCPRPPTVVVSDDNGRTWDIRTFPGEVGQSEIDPDITITPDGTAYMLIRGADQITYLLRSPDRFETWEGPYRIAPDTHVLDAFTAIGSGDDGRIVMAYLGTRTEQPISPDPAEPSFASGGTRWHLFITTSTDADAEEPTFVTRQVTPDNDPVQVGCIWMLGGSGGPNLCRNLLDFIDLAVDPNDGRAYVAVTDGCTPRNGCAGDPYAAVGQSRDRQVMVAVQTGGWSLFQDVGTIEPIHLERPERVEPGEGGAS